LIIVPDQKVTADAI